MTPDQRAAALRLADELSLFDGSERESLRDEAAALLRELAASEAIPDWYARGQDWGLADALTNGQSGDWVLDDIARAFAAGAAAKTTMTVEISADPEMLRRAMAAETEAALLRAALDQKHAEYVDLQRHGNNAAHNLARMQAALTENASRSAD